MIDDHLLHCRSVNHRTDWMGTAEMRWFFFRKLI
jgi:hypothetical protein